MRRFQKSFVFFEFFASVFGALGLSLALSACSAGPQVARDLANAARPSRLPLVVACWEKEFEASSFQGEFIANISFTMEGGSSRIQHAKVIALEPANAKTEARDLSAFRSCVEEALNHSALPTYADQNGPGFQSQGSLSVTNYRILFADASEEKRRAAEKRVAHVLLGPRADRCQGMYSHDPPRDTARLYDEIASNEAKAERVKNEDRDVYARELQRAYDAKLELRERMLLDRSDETLPLANKKRIDQVLKDIEQSARKTGKEIGCELPTKAR